MRRTKQYNVFNKIRAALRDVYRFSPMRKEAIAYALGWHKDSTGTYFNCPICKKEWPIQMADVDHEPPLGPLTHFTTAGGEYTDGLGHWAERLFYGDVQVICKICHKRKTAQQRKKK